MTDTSTMRLTPPMTIPDGALTSSAPDPAPAWNSVTAYVVGDVRSKNRRLFKATGNNTNKDPEVEKSVWLDVGPMNEWAMFDYEISTQTVDTDELQVTIDLPGRIDTLGLFNVDAASVNITLLKGGVEVYNQDFSMVSYLGIANYWDHHFNRVKRRRTLYVTGLPIVTGLTLIVTATGTGMVGIGQAVFNRSDDLGGTLYGAEAGYLSYSNIQADPDFGKRTIVKRDYKKQGSFDVWIANAYTDYVYDVVTSYDATPVMICASDKFNMMIYFCLIITAKIVVPYNSHSTMRIQLEDF